MTSVPQFGRARRGVTYHDRPSVYGLVYDRLGHLLVCQTPRRVILPGGGVDAGETSLQALAREVAEETGLAVTSAELLCRANQYVDDANGKTGRNKIGEFYVTTVRDNGDQPIDQDHALMWLTHDDARAMLSHEAHRWAVERWCGRDLEGG